MCQHNVPTQSSQQPTYERIMRTLFLQLRLLSVCATVCLLTACNGDLFVDKVDIPPMTEVAIEGDGGEYHFPFPAKGLRQISVDLFDDRNLTYLGHDGEELDPKLASPADLVEIRYTSVLLSYSIQVKTNSLTVHTLENATSEAQQVTVRLSYDYEVKFLVLNIEAGKPLEMVRMEYDEHLEVTDRYKTKSKKTRFANNTSQTQRVKSTNVGFQGVTLVTPAEQWADYQNICMTLPTYTEGKWMLGSAKDIQLKTSLYYNLKSWSEEKYVEIPPNSIVDIVTEVYFSKAVLHGQMTFRTSTSGRLHTTRFEAETIEPVDYEVTVKNAE